MFLKGETGISRLSGQSPSEAKYPWHVNYGAEKETRGGEWEGSHTNSHAHTDIEHSNHSDGTTGTMGNVGFTFTQDMVIQGGHIIRGELFKIV